MLYLSTFTKDFKGLFTFEIDKKKKEVVLYVHTNLSLFLRNKRLFLKKIYKILSFSEMSNNEYQTHV